MSALDVFSLLGDDNFFGIPTWLADLFLPLHVWLNKLLEEIPDSGETLPFKLLTSINLSICLSGCFLFNSKQEKWRDLLVCNVRMILLQLPIKPLLISCPFASSETPSNSYRSSYFIFLLFLLPIYDILLLCISPSVFRAALNQSRVSQLKLTLSQTYITISYIH